MVRLWLQQEHSQNGWSRSMDGWIWDLEIRGVRIQRDSELIFSGPPKKPRSWGVDDNLLSLDC